MSFAMSSVRVSAAAPGRSSHVRVRLATSWTPGITLALTTGSLLLPTPEGPTAG
jgi:hypothetical protein